jgi:hypothetical protein
MCTEKLITFLVLGTVEVGFVVDVSEECAASILRVGVK